MKSRGTHPHRDLPVPPPPPPPVSTAETQCDVVEATAASVQTEAPPSPVSVRCGPDHPHPQGVSQSCGPSRPASPDAAPAAEPAMATVKTSTEVSIPFDAPEPLWKGTSEYPVAEMAEKQRPPISVVAYQASAGIEAGLGRGEEGAVVGASGTGRRDHVGDDDERNGAPGGDANLVAGNVANHQNPPRLSLIHI